jgi:hypothetical protein
MGISFPKPEYNFLQQLYTSTNGPYWLNNTNWNFTNINKYNPCKQEWYGLAVRCFPQIATGVLRIDLSANNLTGTLPPVVTNFTYLTTFVVSKNFLHGKLPFFRNTGFLVNIAFNENSFTGSIPDNMIGINYDLFFSFEAKHNQLVGTIPDWMFTRFDMHFIELGGNFLSGTLSPLVGNLTSLRYLQLYDNGFHGTVPQNISKLTKLEWLALEDNAFSGPILDYVLHLPVIGILTLGNNGFSGTFPSGTVKHSNSTITSLVLSNNYFLGSITNYYCYFSFFYFQVDENYFSGRFPSCHMPLVMFIALDKNSFTGPLDYIFDSSNYSSLAALLVGYNSFTGTFPVQLFSLPSLMILSASQNCFHGELSTAICSNLTNTVGMINLNGLGSSPSCSVEVFKSYYSNSMEGSVPFCLWQLPYLQFFSVSGNGFTGTLPSNLSSAILSKLSLSHNYFSGTIPTTLLQRSFSSFDLSYNKFRGTLDAVDDETLLKVNEGYWNVSNNRLSGRLSSVFHSANKIEILFGNVFKCNNNLPSHDPNVGNYFCGSSQLDYSTFTFFGVIFLLTLGLIYLFRIFRSNFTYKTTRSNLVVPLMTNFSSVMVQNDHLKSLHTQNKRNVERFFSALDFICLLVLYTAAIMIFLALPTYLILNTTNSSFRKYDFEYGWIQTTSFFSGTTPAICLLVISCGYALFFVFMTNHTKDPGIEKLENQSPIDQQKEKSPVFSTWLNYQNGIYVVLALLIVGVNMVTNVTINIYYLISISQDSRDEYVYLIQVAMAIYKIIWDAVISEYVIFILSRFGAVSNLRLLLLVFNTIIGPCIAVVVTGESCLYELFLQPSETSVFDELVAFSPGKAEIQNVTIYTTSFIQLPFMYYYSCGSQALTSFIPVFLYQYCLLPLQNLFKIVVVAKIDAKYIPEIVKKIIPGILRPHDYHLFPKFIDEESIYSSLLIHFFPLVTFGINCPILAVMIIIVVLLDALSWKYFVILFINCDKGLALQNLFSIQQSSGKDEIARTELLNSVLQRNLFSALFKLRWIIVGCCLLFNTLVIFDIVGDQQGWFIALMFVISILVFTVMVSVAYWYRFRVAAVPVGKESDSKVFVENPLFVEKTESVANQLTEIELEQPVSSSHSENALATVDVLRESLEWSDRRASESSSGSFYGSRVVSGFGSFGIDRNRSHSKEVESRKNNCIVH